MSEPRLESVLGALNGCAPDDHHDALVRLFEECHGPVFRYVRSFGIDASTSEDVAQEVFLALHTHLGHRRANTNVKGWLFRVARNMALKHRAGASRWAQVIAVPSFVPSAIDPSPNAEERMVDEVRRQRWQAVLTVLPERDRQCLLLRAEGLRYREIAEALGVSLGTVANGLARALERFQRADWG